jgi:hypothetical protein
MGLPRTDLLFEPGVSPAEVATRYDELLAKCDGAATRSIQPHQLPEHTGMGIDFSTGATSARTPIAELEKALAGDMLTKSVSPDQLATLTSALDVLKAQVPDLVKDISPTSPIASGLQLYDLETGAKMLTPRPTPLRNRIPRGKGVGKAHEYKRITGFTGTGTGGVGVMRPGISDSTQTNFANPGSANNLFYNRGPKISYAGDSVSVPYIQFSASDQLSWSTQYQGQGYQDLRALSRASLIYASMLLEERVDLYGRGTAAGFSGVLAAPTGVAGAARAAVAGETGITNGAGNIYVRVVAENGDFGVSQATAASAAIAYTTGQVVDITYTLPVGATGARVFVSNAAGADPGDAARFLYTFTGGSVRNGRSGYNTITIQSTLPAAGTVPTAWPSTLPGGGTINLTAADGGSAYANEYDGIWSYCSGANAGYTNKLNAVFSTLNPGVEYQTAFAGLYDAVKASPDRVMLNGFDRKQLSDAIKGSANSNYVMRVQQDEITGISLGTVVTAIVNEVTGDNVATEVHPWLPQGNSPIISDTLPIPNSEVDSVFKIFDVQALMGVDWTPQQFAFESSSYWLSTMVCYAPAWCGSLSGIKLA